MTDAADVPDDVARKLLGVQREPRVRKPSFSRADSVPNAVPLAPQVRANIRRVGRDSLQLSWDAARSPEAMLAAVKGTGSVLLPVARFMHETVQMFQQRTGGLATLDPKTVALTLHSSARLLHKGDVAGAIMFLSPIRKLLTRGADGPEGIERVRVSLCDVIRGLYPNAPDTWTSTFVDPTPRPAPLEGEKALPGPTEEPRDERQEEAP